MMNRFVKNGTVSKFWLTEVTGPPPEVMPNILVINIRGHHVSMHCSMTSDAMESFLSFLFLSINHAFELPDFGTVAAIEVNGSVVTA